MTDRHKKSGDLQRCNHIALRAGKLTIAMVTKRRDFVEVKNMFKFLCQSDVEQTKGCVFKRGFTPKQQQIADREHELLHIAKQLVEQDGFNNFTMDKLTAASPYSKGTIYNHFSSKEDVITALCTSALRHEMSFLKRALAFEGTTRERVLALHVAYVTSAKVEPVLLNCLMTAKTPWVMQKASKERLQVQEELEQQCTQLIDAAMTAAVQSGDLKLSSNSGLDCVSFANWAVTFGSIALLSSANSCHSIARVKDHNVFLFSINCVLDGLNWQPLSHAWDYQRTWQRIEQEIFSAELDALDKL